ncbi:pPIWI_RE module domain-containing protein [Streptomyces sp. NPDC017529]|uniref:pPIWI_RE module domain-containing protein n=1 Tax=Streptomyces sp. NPDC017529 TaxID=3365000 RepID=UPI0037ACDEC0
MTRYDAIRLARFAPAPGAAWTVAYHTLSLPEFHRKRLLDLYRLGLRKPDTCHGVPVGRLNALLQALTPEVVSVAKWIDVARDEPWLYARTPVPGDVLSALLTTWVQDLRPEPEHRLEVRKAMRELRFGELRWEKQDVSMLSRATTPSGTAAPEDRLYQLLPDAIADLVLGCPDPFTYPGGSLAFRGVARRPSDRGAELLSWPPDRYDDQDGRSWWFSALLTVTLQTVPFSPDLQIHVRSGVRRWATRTGRNGLYLPPRRAASVYLLADAPWIGDGPRSSARFSVGRLAYDRELGARAWEAGGPSGMLTRLRLRRPLPEPGELLRSPGDWLDRTGQVAAAVVHSTAMGSHGVKAGLMPGDRVPLMEWFEQALPEGLVRAPDQVRADRHLRSRRGARKSQEEPEARDADETAALRREVAGPLEGEPLRLEFLWLTRPNRDAGVRALRTVLGLPEEVDPALQDQAGDRGEETLSWRTPELTVELRLTSVGELADGLSFPADGHVRTEVLRTALAARRDQVVRRLPEAPAKGRVTLALVEIHHKDAYSPRSADPKFALRLGFRDAGRVTQFVVNPRRATSRFSDADTARAKKFEACWTDGLRQLGHRAVPDHRLGPVVPDDMQYAALWLVRRRRDGPTRQADLVPITVRIRPTAPAAERITGWDHRSGTWVSYPELLIRLAGSAELPTAEDDVEPSEWDADAPSEPDGAEDNDGFDPDTEPGNRIEQRRTALASTVQEILFGLRDRPTLLLLHAQNTRQLWPWLQNGHIQPDMIQLHGQQAQRIALQGRDLRVVRVRDHTGTETPQWWGHREHAQGDTDGEDKSFGIPTGLWKPPGCDERHRVFGSTSEKAGPGTQVSVMASRWALRPYTRGDKSGITIDTGRLAWNPALLEITVAACRPDDDPELWAALTHRLRQSPGRDPLLALPLPLQLARKASEYVLPTAQEQPSEPDEDDGAVQLSFELGAITP